MKTICGLGHLLVAVSLVCDRNAEASRVQRPMGAYVREAELIVIADTRKGGERGYDTILTIKEVIKGDAQKAGTEIVLGLPRSTDAARVPAPASNVAILLRKDWRAQKPWPVLEAYTKTEEVAAVRTLVDIYQLPEERSRLLELRERALAGTTVLLAQLLADLTDMRESNNFDVITNLYNALTSTNQAKLVDIIARTDDSRAVPALLKAMVSPDKKVSGAAARHLSWLFPGAPGVTDAFEQALWQEPLARIAARYLAKRRDDPALDAIKGHDTPWLAAQRLWDTGKRDEARVAYLAIIEEPNASNFAIRNAALKLLPDATPAEKERIRKAVLPSLADLARGGNYLEIGDAAQILRELRHPDCLPVLLAIVPRAGYLYWRAARTATRAIRELGSAARQQGVARLIEDLNPGTRGTNPRSDTTTQPPRKEGTTTTRNIPGWMREKDAIPYLLEIIWLADKDTFSRIANAIPDPWRAPWKTLSPLRAIADEKDEDAFLIQTLGQSNNLPAQARQWIIFCLGDLKDKRAVRVLVETLTRETDPSVVQAARDALIGIDGFEVEKEMLPLLTHDQRQTVRPAAVEVLFRLQGERACDLARRMLREEDFGLKQPALLHLQKFGTVDDLALLLPYCDYWKADRTIHYWAVQAVSSIRERCHYDVNGPILKTSSKK